MLEFTIGRTGNYKFTTWYPEGQEQPEVIFSIGQGFAKKIVGVVIGGFAICLVSLALAVAIVIIVFVKRRKAA